MSLRRYWGHVDIGLSDQCWPWKLSLDRKGYGTYCVRRGWKTMAHRHAYELTFGAIPSGMFVCHRCDNPSCCNPAHLFIGTAADNNADMRAKGRHARGSRNGQSKLSESAVAEIRASSDLQDELARRFSVSQSQISRIRAGKTRREVTCATS